jgi:hypothetical protein
MCRPARLKVKTEAQKNNTKTTDEWTGRVCTNVVVFLKSGKRTLTGTRNKNRENKNKNKKQEKNTDEVSF